MNFIIFCAFLSFNSNIWCIQCMWIHHLSLAWVELKLNAMQSYSSVELYAFWGIMIMWSCGEDDDKTHTHKYDRIIEANKREAANLVHSTCNCSNSFKRQNFKLDIYPSITNVAWHCLYARVRKKIKICATLSIQGGSIL